MPHAPTSPSIALEALHELTANVAESAVALLPRVGPEAVRAVVDAFREADPPIPLARIEGWQSREDADYFHIVLIPALRPRPGTPAWQAMFAHVGGVLDRAESRLPESERLVTLNFVVDV